MGGRLQLHQGSCTIRGEGVCDGGLSHSLPDRAALLAPGAALDCGWLVDQLAVPSTTRVVLVSPLSGKGKDICPQSEGFGSGLLLRQQHCEASLKNLRRAVMAVVCPSVPALRRLFREGYNDAERFLKEEGISS